LASSVGSKNGGQGKGRRAFARNGESYGLDAQGKGKFVALRWTLPENAISSNVIGVFLRGKKKGPSILKKGKTVEATFECATTTWNRWEGI